MNVLFVTHELNQTGAPMALLNMIRFFKDRGDEISIISLFDGPSKGRWESEFGVHIKIKQHFLKEFWDVREEMEHYDLVILNTLYCYELVHVLNGADTAVLWWIHEGAPNFELLSPILPFDKLRDNIHVYAVSHVAASPILERWGIKVPILPLGVSIPSFINNPWERSDKGHELVRFITVGNYGFIKGQDILLESLFMLDKDVINNSLFVFCGDEGKEKNEEVFSLVKETCNILPNVSRIGKMPRDELLGWIGNADYTIIPSRSETVSAIAVEGMSYGTPPIISDACGAADAIRDEADGFIFPSEDSSVLSKKIERAVSLRLDSEAYGGMSDGAKRAYESNYSLENFEKNMNGILGII